MKNNRGSKVKPTFVNSVKRPVNVKVKEEAEDIAMLSAIDVISILD